MARRYIQQKPQSRQELSDALVRNAIDFVESALDTLDRRPKNAIVEFYTAIELFLKARLMAEHWSLIIAKPETGSLQAFSVGDFQSVYLDDSAKRLKEIVGEPLDETALRNFRSLGEHRNQIVHFAHTDYATASGTRTGVVLELWASWHYLQVLLTQTWKTSFAAYQDEIRRLHSRMMKQAEFIQVRYHELEPQIAELTSQGSAFVRCNHCQTTAGKVEASHKWGFDYRCLVCQSAGLAIKRTDATIPCDLCGTPLRVFDKDLVKCRTCSQPLDTDKRITLCQSVYKDGDDWWEEGAPHIAECHVCMYHRPTVFYVDGLWSCVSCFDRGWQAVSCPHCGEFVTGDMDAIKHACCFKCG